jgi:hypothetical protein
MLQPYAGLVGPLGREGAEQSGVHEARGTRLAYTLNHAPSYRPSPVIPADDGTHGCGPGNGGAVSPGPP